MKIEQGDKAKKDSTVNKTEYRSERNPKLRWAQQAAKASGPYHLINS